MASTNIGVVYSTRQRTIRRIVSPDNDAQLTAARLCGPGESLYVTSRIASSGGLDAIKALLASAIGAAENDLCAICNGQDQVRGVVRCDPQIVNDTKMLAQGWYIVDAIPDKIQTGTFVDEFSVTQPIYSAITVGWFYNPTTGNFGLTKNP